MTPEERLDRIEKDIDKQNEGIRDLIRSSRAVIDAQLKTDEQIREVSGQIQQLREAQQHTDDKLNILIDTVDRMIRHRNGGGKGNV
jgi:ABC-type transporter Mla subunit MlaD